MAVAVDVMFIVGTTLVSVLPAREVSVETSAQAVTKRKNNAKINFLVILISVISIELLVVANITNNAS